jgi:hypothetical protein
MRNGSSNFPLTVGLQRQPKEPDGSGQSAAASMRNQDAIAVEFIMKGAFS